MNKNSFEKQNELKKGYAIFLKTKTKDNPLSDKITNISFWFEIASGEGLVWFLALLRCEVLFVGCWMYATKGIH